jgi:hypothetical protein
VTFAKFRVRMNHAFHLFEPAHLNYLALACSTECEYQLVRFQAGLGALRLLDELSVVS